VTVDFGGPVSVWRSRRLPVSGRVDRRVVVVCAGLCGLLVVLAAVSLASGSYPVALPDVLAALAGRADAQVHMLVVEWRLPRLLLAVGCGAALALSGAVFQSLTRNPLGSPDVIGFGAGSYTGALVVMLVMGSASYALTALGAVVGGLVTAAAVSLLAYRGGVQGFRLVIVGIGVGAMLTSINSYLLLRADPQVALQAAAWGAGSLAALGFAQLVPFALALGLLLPAVVALSGSLAQLELGDDAARSHGTHAERARLGGSVLGVALIALVTAAAGPIAFVALVAPQIGHRLTGRPGPGLAVAALTGAVLLTFADLLAQRLGVSTGLVTVTLGGLFLIRLLVLEYRRP
jgi:iron complex transport system permease protein